MKKSLLTLCLCVPFLFSNCIDPTLRDQQKLLEELKLNAEAFKQKHFCTLTAIVDETTYPANTFMIYLEGQKGKIKVAWGDGSSSEYSLEGQPFLEIQHTYSSSGMYPVTLSGDLKYIETFHSYYGIGMLNDINFKSLSNLKEVAIGLTFSPTVIDLSANEMLEEVEMIGLHELQQLLLPKKHKITRVDLSGPNALSSAALDAIIDNIYHSTVKNKIMQGHFVLTNNWIYNEEEVPEMLGPPSATALNQLRELQNTYQWTIVPAL